MFFTRSTKDVSSFELKLALTSAYGFEDLETIYTNKYNDKREQLRAKNIVSKMKALCCEIIID